MKKTLFEVNPWKIIEEGFEKENVKSAESIFSIGNGNMGQRANFEEFYSGTTFQGSYIGGVYYPDKTKVGWWKNGYPEYFAKVPNAPSWLGIKVVIDDVELDLNTCEKVENFQRTLDMQKGIYTRECILTLSNNVKIKLKSERFLSMANNEIGAIKYSITPLNKKCVIDLTPYLDSYVKNEDANWEEIFWDTTKVIGSKNEGFILSHTLKTEFKVATYMQNKVYIEGVLQENLPEEKITDKQLSYSYNNEIDINQTISLVKLGGYITDINHPDTDLKEYTNSLLTKIRNSSFENLYAEHINEWKKIWDNSDIVIEGDEKAQQAIRFNIFQLNQTYTGKNALLNIGPKGFTGEKYGGSTYWDTEAYCLPFYMATKTNEIALNLLKYRYYHLSKAIENAEKLGFKDGAALYPMVTMNGEECHNEWEITFEEIHRNGAIAWAIYNYERFTGDTTYVPKMGLEVLIGIARFWAQRANFSEEKQKYVILGVTGPNEYENNINNNWYTNYIAKWCLNYAAIKVNEVRAEYQDDYVRIESKTKLSTQESDLWQKIANEIFFPFSEEHQVYLQQDGFLDKELNPVDSLSSNERPLNQNWSWDRILRSPYIKQADVLQGFYFFEEHFSKEELQRHFDFYEPLTVHESSLSPCIHSILASKIGYNDKAYDLYLRTARLDLDDYNKEIEEGLHITSMAGTWLSIIEGFAGMSIKNEKLSFVPSLPKNWKSLGFKINFKERLIEVNIDNKNNCSIVNHTQSKPISILVNGEIISLK